MKLRIETSQLNELSDAQKQKLRELWEPQVGDFATIDGDDENILMAIYDVGMGCIDVNGGLRNDIDKEYLTPILSIGQMIEILSEILLDISIVPKSLLAEKRLWSITITFRKTTFMKSFEGLELCDILWQAVKEILN